MSKTITDHPIATDVLDMLCRWASYGVSTHKREWKDGMDGGQIHTDRQTMAYVLPRLEEIVARQEQETKNR